MQEKSRVLADLEYLEQLISSSTPEELVEASSSIYSLSIRNIGKINNTAEHHLKGRYMTIINRLLKYLPDASDHSQSKQEKQQTQDILPTKVVIDASTICQLRCKSCSFQRDKYHVLGKGFLTYENFKAFLDNNKYIKEIELSNYGEIFLNPELKEIIQYAFEKKVALKAQNGVNFNSVTDEVLETLVKYKFRVLSFSIDGASQEIYSIYRINGNFDTVISNIQKLIKYKHKYNSAFPELKWKYILLEHNENDIIKAKRMAADLGIEIYFKLTYEMGYMPKNIEMLKKETGLMYLNREKVLEATGRPYANICRQLWKKPIINYDGRLLGCCCNASVDFGVNVFEIGLAEALNSANYKYAKEMLLGKVGIPEHKENIPCVKCKYYKLMCDTGKYLTPTN